MNEEATTGAGSSRNLLWTILLSLCASAANIGMARLSGALRLGLFLDTVFIITAVFSGGLSAGLLTAILSTVFAGISYYQQNGVPYFWGYYLYGLCSLATAVLVRFFVRLFPEECKPLRLFGGSAGKGPGLKGPGLKGPGLKGPDKKIIALDLLIMLTLLSLALCALISIMGGFIAVFINRVLQTLSEGSSNETAFKLGLLQRGIGLTVAEIMARLPINIIDRPLSACTGYGAALLLKKVFIKTVSG